MANIIIAPGKYVQGRGELKNLGAYLAKFGKKAFLIISESGKKRVSSLIDEGFEGKGCSAIYALFGGECTKGEISRLLDEAQAQGCDVIVGVGGGKILDTAKAVAYYAKLPVAIVPTIASTDAPCSALSVIYTEEGAFEEYLFLPANPNLVLMDTDVIAAAPARLLISGMGDALATYFEARATKASGGNTCAGGKVTAAAMGLARLCYDTLLSDGLKAALAAEQKVCTQAVENIIEANTLLSGIGFESGGLAGAHAIHNGFTILPQCHTYYHGEKVAFGTLVQLMLENAPVEEIAEVVDFCQTVGLPTTLSGIGLEDAKKEELMAVAEAAAAPGESIHNLPFPVDAEKIYAAILAADAAGRFYGGEETCQCGCCE